jgi:hypothetical protein
MMDYDEIKHCKDCEHFEDGDCTAPEITSFAKLVSGARNPDVMKHSAFEMRAAQMLCGLYARWFDPIE